MVFEPRLLLARRLFYGAIRVCQNVSIIVRIVSLVSGSKSYLPSGPLIQPTGNVETISPCLALVITRLAHESPFVFCFRAERPWPQFARTMVSFESARINKSPFRVEQCIVGRCGDLRKSSKSSNCRDKREIVATKHRSDLFGGDHHLQPLPPGPPLSSTNP